MKRGSLSGRVTRLEDSGVAVCPVCHGRGGAIGVYVEGPDGVCRDRDGRPMPAGDPSWTCAGCGTYYEQRPIIIAVEGRSKSLGASA